MARVFWTQQQPFGPSPRLSHAMAYDSTHKVTILFGGRSSSGEFGDTWEWDGTLWTQVSDIGPAGRAEHAVAFDEMHGQVVLFGGLAGSNVFGDTWIWDGSLWTQISDVGPSARSGHALAYDRTRRRAVLFGGRQSDGAALGDTWEWDGSAWTQQEASGPGARSQHAMAYDAARSRVVLFGGTTETSSLADTWEWDGTSWSEVAHFGPPARFGTAIVFNGSRTTLFGGAKSNSSNDPAAILGDTWEWDGHHWTQQQHFGPAPRVDHAMTFDTDHRRVVLFGGSSAFTSNDGNSRGDTWQHTPVVSAPPATLASFQVVPADLAANETFTLTAALTEAATAEVAIAIAVDTPIAGLPAQLTVAVGATSATSDPIQAPAPGLYQFSATVGSTVLHATLSVVPLAPSSVVQLLAEPNVRDVGETCVLQVFVTPIPATQTTVTLSSQPAFAGLPETINVDAGQDGGEVEFPASVEGTFTLTATLNSSAVSTTLRVDAPAAGTDLASLQIFPETVPQNTPFALLLSIRNPATAPVTVSLSATPGIGSLPTTAVVEAGQDVVAVSIQQAPAPGRYTIKATAGAVSLDASLTVV